MSVIVPCALKIGINPTKRSNLRSSDITTVMTALNNSRQLDPDGNPVVADKKTQNLINRWLKAGVLEITPGPLSTRHIRTDSPLHVGFELVNEQAWTDTDLYPGLLRRLGLSEQAKILTRSLNDLEGVQAKYPGRPRMYNLSALQRLVRQPNFDDWYSRQPGHSTRSAYALKQLVNQLEHHGILPRR